MFEYNIGDIMVGCLAILLILVIVYKFGRYHYLKSKYKKCPICGSKTKLTEESEHYIGEVKTFIKFECSDNTCGWSENLFFHGGNG